MGWRKIPATRGWEVNEELTFEGNLLLRRDDGAQFLSCPLQRLNALLGQNFGDFEDRRVTEKPDGTVEIVLHSEPDLKLFCTPVDYTYFIEMHALWQREKWQSLEEQMLLEKCLDELYKHGSLTTDTSSELKEYQALLQFKGNYNKEPSGEFDFETVVAHPLFVLLGLNMNLDLSDREVRKIQLRAEAELTGRYDLQTVRKVKLLQENLRREDIYKGEINGLWKKKMKVAWAQYRKKQSLGDIIIEDFIAKHGYNPRETILSPSLVESLWAPDSLWVGNEQLNRFLGRKEAQGEKVRDLIIQIGLTFKDGKLVPVYAMVGGKLMEDVADKIHTAAILRESEKAYTNAIKQLAQELEARGLTPENLKQMAADIYKYYNYGELIFLFGGTVRKLTGEGLERFLRSYADEFIKKKGGKLTSKEQKLLLRKLGKLTPKELRKIGHHLFPSALKKQFARAGINVNKKEFLEYIGKEFHKVAHAKGTIRPNDWVEWWRRFFKPFKKKAKVPKPKQVLNGLRKCLEHFEFPNVDEIMRRVSGNLLP